MEQMAVSSLVQGSHKSKQNLSRLCLWVSCCSLDNESLHVHMTHLVGNAEKGRLYARKTISCDREDGISKSLQSLS